MCVCVCVCYFCLFMFYNSRAYFQCFVSVFFISSFHVICHQVAFIGISNWALDPAKMNRGILVQRDVPDEMELVQTAEYGFHLLLSLATEEPLMIDHPDDRLLWCQTTLMTDNFDDRPL